MKEHIDLMDKAIKEKFDGHEVPVPAHLWNSIESNLAPENKSTNSSSFLKNPFILSLIVISTVLIGTYIYHYSNKKTANASVSFNEITTNVNTSSSAESTNDAYNHSSLEEKNHTATSTSKNTNEEGNQTAIYSSNILTEELSNTHVSKNKNSTSTRNHSTVQHHSSTAIDKASVKNTYSISNNITDKQPQQHSSTKNNTIATSKSNKISISNTYSNDNLAKINKNNTVYSDSKISTNLNPSESKNTSSITSSKTQSTKSVDIKNNALITSHTDSIKIDASTFMQELYSFTNNKDSDTNTSLEYNASIDVSNDTDTATSNQNTQLNTYQISNATLSLNSHNTLSTPSETVSLYNQGINANELNEASSTNKLFKSAIDANSPYTSSKKNIIDSANNRNPLENYFHPNSTTNDTNLSFETAESSKELLLKIDSTIIYKLDSNSIEKLPKTIEVTSSEVEKNKKSLFLSRCSFDGYASPALEYMYLSSNSSQEGVSTFTKERNKNAHAGFGITTGLRINYTLTQKIEIGIAFQYSSASQPSSLTQQHVDSSYNTFRGYTQTDSTYDSTSHRMIYTNHFVVTDTTTITRLSSHIIKHTDKFQNFSIPIHIAYGYSISNKLSLLARTSLLINYQTSSVTYLNTSDSSIIGYHSNKNISLGGSLSVGCYYQFSRKYTVFTEPIVTYYFSNVFEKQVPFKQKQLMLGLQTGIRLSF